MTRRLKIDYNAPFCLTFCLLAMLVYVAALFTNGWVTAHWFSIPGSAGFTDWTTYPRLILHVLGHASAPHLFANLTILLLITPMLEEMYGTGLLVALALVTAVITGLLMVFLFPGTLLGASSIVFAFIILSSFANARSGTIPLTFILVCLIFIGGELIRSLNREDTIAQFAHVAGGILGGMAGFLMAKRAETPRW
ncbi:MAG: rhomboid family intramembrane serine protease [Opitutales bacterium]|jgi:membrane associated rhomboid family serine protease